ncbi:MAG: DNA translocase FtsK [Flavobacteriales bacterium]|nr:DNA translocase FtsK [Flavobacteriales bacterium]
MARKPSTKAASKKKKPASKASFKIPSVLSDRRVKRVFGLFLLLAAIYLLLAFTAFMFTWKEDQSLLSENWWVILREGSFEAQNWLGPLGAMMGHLFIYEWFGITSFSFVMLLLLFGNKVLTGKSPLPLMKTTVSAFVGMLIFSPALAFVFDSPEHQILGGRFGFELDQSLAGKVGVLGTGFLLLFAAAGFISIVFNPSFSFLSKWFELVSTKTGTLVRILKAKSASIHSQEEDLEEEEKYFEDTIGQMDSFTDMAAADLAMADLEIELEESTPEKEEIPFTPNFELEVEEKETEDEGFEIVETSPVAKVKGEGKEEFTVEAPKEEKSLSDREVNRKVNDYGEYDPTLDLSSFQMPKIDLLENHGDGKVTVSKEELEANKNKIVTTLSHYKIGIEKIKATIGPTVTLYEIVPEPGVRISKIRNLEDDIALSLAALGIRIIAPIPGKGTIGIEVPNSKADTVSMKSVVASEKFQNTKFELPVALGKTISNETFVTDLAKMPHLLMAGATGQGKSVGLNAILVSLLYKKHPSQIKFVLVDPKKVELTLFNKIERHYLAKLPDEEESIITDTAKVVKTLNSLCIEMDDRYELLKNAGVRNLKEYNGKFIQRKLNPEEGHKYLPYIVLVIDEFADLIMTAGKEVETPIARLAQLARAIGIHLIIATQRPSVNIITGVIKANFPARIAFRVSSKIDSRTILDAGGADQLIGRGDMLLSTGNDMIRLQCAFVDTPEVDEITEFIGNQRGYPSAFDLPEYVGDEEGSALDIDIADRDAMFEDAARLLVATQQGSTSLIQRKLKLGYNRAGRIVDQLEAAGIVGPFEGSKARQVLIPDEYSLEQLLKAETENIEN